MYDATYIDQHLEANRDLLPIGFNRADVQRIKNCPGAVVEIRLMIDPAEDGSHGEPKDVPCEKQKDAPK